jgi:hypothetical protein
MFAEYSNISVLFCHITKMSSVSVWYLPSDLPMFLLSPKQSQLQTEEIQQTHHSAQITVIQDMTPQTFTEKCLKFLISLLPHFQGARVS